MKVSYNDALGLQVLLRDVCNVMEYTKPTSPSLDDARKWLIELDRFTTNYNLGLGREEKPNDTRQSPSRDALKKIEVYQKETDESLVAFGKSLSDLNSEVTQLRRAAIVESSDKKPDTKPPEGGFLFVVGCGIGLALGLGGGGWMASEFRDELKSDRHKAWYHGVGRWAIDTQTGEKEFLYEKPKKEQP